MAERRDGITDLKVDRGNLYREEVITDLKVATVRQLSPILLDGTADRSRTVLFIGQTQVLTQAGPIPVEAPINASNLEEAVERFPEAVNRALDQMLGQIEELRRREASRIVVPGGGGGKILMP